MTIDETWIHYYIPESKQQAKQDPEGLHQSEKTQQSVGKIMSPVFWDSSRILFIDYLEKGKTINIDYHCALLARLKEGIARKRPHLFETKCIFSQDNAPAHKSIKTVAKTNVLHFDFLPYPPYSPDLAPSNFYMFPYSKRWLQEQRFSSNIKERRSNIEKGR